MEAKKMGIDKKLIDDFEDNTGPEHINAIANDVYVAEKNNQYIDVDNEKWLKVREFKWPRGSMTLKMPNNEYAVIHEESIIEGKLNVKPETFKDYKEAYWWAFTTQYALHRFCLRNDVMMAESEPFYIDIEGEKWLKIRDFGDYPRGYMVLRTTEGYYAAHQGHDELDLKHMKLFSSYLNAYSHAWLYSDYDADYDMH
jgi:hypothetical protein